MLVTLNFSEPELDKDGKVKGLEKENFLINGKPPTELIYLGEGTYLVKH